VHRIVGATDPGYAVNPAQIERQVAGSFVYGLSALFHGGCTVKDGRIEQTNFHDYNSMRISEMPKVESIVLPNTRLRARADAELRQDLRRAPCRKRERPAMPGVPSIAKERRTQA
jgi:CO/xanthine dehydrogenase Mo-binding subunit